MKKFLSIILSTVLMLTAVLGFNFTASAYSIDFSSAEEYVPGEEATCEFNEYHYGVYYVDLPNSAYLLQSLPAESATRFSVYNVDNTNRQIVSNALGQSEDDLKDLYLVAGEYYFVFEDVQKNHDSVDFCFEAEECEESFPESTTNNNNSTSTANTIELKETYNGMLAANDYEDFYKFIISNSGSYTVNVEPTDERVIRCSLYKADGVSNVGAWNVGGDYSTDLQSFNLDAGTYFLKIYTSQYGGMYKFNIDATEVPNETPVDPDDDDDSDNVDEQPTEPSNGGIDQVDPGHISLPTFPSLTPTTQPAASEPTTSAPAPTQPAASEPTTSAPAPAQPATPAPAQPTTQAPTTQAHTHAYNFAYSVPATVNSRGYDVLTCSCGDSIKTNYTKPVPIGKVKFKSVKAIGKKKIQAKWSKKAYAEGYQVRVSTSKNFKKTKTFTWSGGNRTSGKVTGLKKGKKYYVKVRAYRTVDGSRYFGSWSSVKTVKCK